MAFKASVSMVIVDMVAVGKMKDDGVVLGDREGERLAEMLRRRCCGDGRRLEWMLRGPELVGGS